MRRQLKLLKYPKPYINESLANYIYRLSEANSTKFIYVLEYFGINKIYNISMNTINKINEKDILERISADTNNTYEEINLLTINNYYVDKLSRRETYFKGQASYFCPECLKEKHYHQIHWVLNKGGICTKHNIGLINKCDECNSMITVRDVVSGMCNKCNKILKEISSSENITEPIYFKQYMKYFTNYKLIQDKEYAESVIKRYHFYYSFCLRNLKILKKINDFSSYFDRDDCSTAIIIFLEYLMENPNELINKISKCLHNNLVLDRDTGNWKLGSMILESAVLSPLLGFELMRLNYRELREYKLLNHEQLLNYISEFNPKYIKDKLQEIIKEDYFDFKYRDIICSTHIEGLYRNHVRDGNLYVNINEFINTTLDILNYSYKEECSFSSEIEMVSIDRVLYMFSRLGIDIYIIFNIIYSEKLKIVIDPVNFDVDIEKKTIIDEILKVLKYRLDNKQLEYI